MPGGLHRDLTATGWATPSAVPPLTDGAIHVWRIRDAGSHAPPPALTHCLSSPERTRGRAFRFPVDARTYRWTRSVLRHLLGNYLQTPPEQLVFAYGPQGKPRLVEAGTDLQFNVSHSRGCAILAFGKGSELGVDVEWEDDGFDPADLVKRYFTPAESADILRGDERAKRQAFFRAWTRKEAFLKANGGGLSLPLEAFGVTIRDDQPVRLRKVDWNPAAVSDYRLAGFTCGDRLPGALCWRGSQRALHFYDYPT